MAGGGGAYKVMTLAATVGAGIAARKSATGVWKIATGKEPPVNPVDPDVQWREAAAWAVVSGACVGIGRLLASRQTALWFRKVTGHLPPNAQKAAS